MTGKSLSKKCRIIIIIIILLGIISSFLSTNFFSKYFLSSGDSYRIYLNSKYEKLNSGSLQVIEYLIMEKITGLSVEFIIRIISLLVYIIIGILILGISRKISLSKFSIILVAFLFFLNPWILNYSQDAEKGLFIVLFSMIFFIILRTVNYRFLIIIIFLISSLGYHISGTLIFAALIIFLLTDKNSKNNLPFLKVMAIFIISLIIAFPIIRQSLEFNNNLFDNSVKTQLGEENQIIRTIYGFYDGLILGKIGMNELIIGISRYLYNSNILFIALLFIIFIVPIFFFIYREYNKENEIKSKIYLLLIFLFINLIFFSLSFESASHKTRYPIYILPFFFVIIGLSLDKILEKVKLGKRIFLLSFIIFIIFILGSITKIPEPISITRSLNYFHIQSLDNLNLKINSDEKILIPGWASLEYSLEKFNIHETQIKRYGWNKVNLSEISKAEYVNKNNIKYFLYLKPTQDYYESSSLLFSELTKSYNLIEVYSTKIKGKELIIYKLE